MSDNTEQLFEVPPDEPKPKKKARKPISAEQRQRLLDNLKKGRETSRQKREQVKKTSKEETPKPQEPEPKQTFAIPHTIPADNSKELELQIKEMRLMINEYRRERENEKKEAELKDLRAQLKELMAVKKEVKAEEKRAEKVELIRPKTPEPEPTPPPPPLKIVTTSRRNKSFGMF